MSMSQAPHAEATHAEHSVHAVPPRVLLLVFGALLALTIVTVGASDPDVKRLLAALGVQIDAVAIWVALGLALVKAALVALYFMHLRYDSPFYGMVLITALLFVMLFIAIALLDTTQYQPNIVPAAGT